jgi:hypothetical protein
MLSVKPKNIYFIKLRSSISYFGKLDCDFTFFDFIDNLLIQIKYFTLINDCIL